MAGRFGDGRFTNLSRNAEERRTEPGMGKTAAVEPRRYYPVWCFVQEPKKWSLCVRVARAFTAETDQAAELHALHYWLAATHEHRHSSPARERLPCHCG